MCLPGKRGAVGKEAADFFYPVSIREKEKILKQCKRIRPDGAVTIASELANITVSYLTEKTGAAWKLRPGVLR